MHLKHPSRALRRELYEGQRMDIREKRREEMRREEEERRNRDRDYHGGERAEFKTEFKPEFKPEFKTEFKSPERAEY